MKSTLHTHSTHLRSQLDHINLHCLHTLKPIEIVLLAGYNGYIKIHVTGGLLKSINIQVIIMASKIRQLRAYPSYIFKGKLNISYILFKLSFLIV